VEVRSVRLGDLDCVGRWSRQSAQSLDWEFALIDTLHTAGLVVPRPVPTRSGERHHQGLTVTPKLPGPHPRGPEDWQAVLNVLRRINELTRDWPPRPGLPGAVDLTDLPAEHRHRLTAGPGPCVVVGRTRRRDIVMTPDGPAFVDFAHARVDWPVLDLVGDPELTAVARIDPETEHAAREALARLGVQRNGED
jgi:hypothetical protein